MRHLFILLLLFSWPCVVQSQITVLLTVDGGTASTTCTDALSDPDPQWGVNVEGEGWVTYPSFLFCFEDPPFLQFQRTYNCAFDLPDSIEVCFRAFEKDGFLCDEGPDCEVIICQNFPLPEAYTSQSYTLSTAPGGASEGSVNFTLAAEGAVTTNDFPCDALDLGVLTPGGFVGDTSTSLFSNNCATNFSEPNPFLLNGWFWNNNGVWFTFEVEQGVGDVLVLDATSDPSGLGNPIDLEMAIFRIDGDTCTDNLQLYRAGSQVGPVHRVLAECLDTGRYYILVDGSDGPGDDPTGYFGLRVWDPQAEAAAEDICNAANLGAVPDGGSILLTNQTNDCADNLGDPPNGVFSVESSVWYQFQPPSTGNTIIEVLNQSPLIELLDAQVAVFSSESGTCLGPFILEGAAYDPADPDESLEFPCLNPDESYWLLIDGEGFGEDDGIFDLQISDGGVAPPLTQIDTAICAGESLVIGDSIYTATGSFTNLFPLPNGCDSTVITNLLVYDALQLQGIELSPVTSALNDNGIATVEIAGGVPPYTLSWSNGATEDTLFNLAVGTYCVNVVDSVGCSAQTCITITEDIPPLLVQTENDTLDCFGDTDGSVQLLFTGADAPYDYAWNNGSGLLNADSSILNLSGLPAGDYQGTVTNQAGETTAFSFSVVEPSALGVAGSTLQPPTCFGGCDGQINVTPSGGTPPYDFSWNAGSMAATADSLCAGLQILQITDQNDCVLDTFFTLSQPPALEAQAEADQGVQCWGDTNGIATVTASGNILTYVWDNGETTPTAEALNAGPHSVTVEDVNGCLDSALVEIPGPVGPLSVSIQANLPVSCPGDADAELEATAEGGYPGTYQFAWSNGSPGAVNRNLPSGTYIVTVTDLNGCSQKDTIQLPEPDPLDLELSSRAATCAGQEQDGLIRVETISGGTPPYTFALNAPDLFVNQDSFGNLPPDLYEVFAEDVNGCRISTTITVAPPPGVGLVMPADQRIDLGESVSLTAIAQGGDALSFTWTPSTGLSCTNCPSPIASPLQSQIYTLQVLDTVSSCFAEGVVRVDVTTSRELYVPNIFSPNGDGFNDQWFIQGDALALIREVQIFDRWGGLVGEARDIAPGQWIWDGQYNGQEAPGGVYIYRAVVQFLDGVEQETAGSITLVR